MHGSYLRMVAAAFAVALIAAPASAHAVTAADGSVASPGVLAREASHPDAAPVEGASGSLQTLGLTGDGRNAITFGGFRCADIVVVLGTPTGHAGLFDNLYYYGSLANHAVWSANVAPVSGVWREACAKFRDYDRAYGLRVVRHLDHAAAARNYCRAQQGEPFVITSSKSDQTRWYCSKLVWAAWRYTAGVDLDGDGGYWVWPVDLITDPETYLFGYWS